MSLNIELKKDEFNRMFWVATGQEGDFFCHTCTKSIDEGYICESNNQIVECTDCMDKNDMQGCKHNKIGEHKHIKWVKGEEMKGVTSSNE